MEIKPELLEKLLAQNDAYLWETIRKVGVMNNISLPQTPPSAEEMQKLRQLLQSGKMSAEEASNILKQAQQRGNP